MFNKLFSRFVRASNGSAIGPWDQRRVGNFRLWIENREHLRIVHINRELILELRRRFPDHQIGVSGIEIDPNGIAFWKKLSDEGLVVASELADCEKILEMHRQAPASFRRESWQPSVRATDAARMLKAEYDRLSSVAQS